MEGIKPETNAGCTTKFFSPADVAELVCSVRTLQARSTLTFTKNSEALVAAHELHLARGAQPLVALGGPA